MLNQISLGYRDLSVPLTHWQEEKDFSFPKTGNIVLIFPGGMVDTPYHANGCAKRFLMTMGKNLPQDTKVLCAYYNDAGVPTHRLKSLKKAKLLTDLKASIPMTDFPQDADFSSFFDSFFMPILFNEIGEQKSAFEICSILNRLLIVTFCYGGFVAYDMAERFEKKLKTMDFSSKEKELILSSFTTLATSSRFFMQKSKTSIVHLVSYSDKQKEVNWHHKNFHAFINTKKRNQAQGAITFLRENEMVLSAEKMLSVETDDHHFRGYFCDASPEFQKTPEGSFITSFIVEFVQLYFKFNGRKKLKDLLPLFSDQKSIKAKQEAGYNLLNEYKKHVLTNVKNFSIQEKLVRLKDVNGMKELINRGDEILSFKNKEGDFLIHIAIQNDDKEMVDLLTKQNPFWFQAYNKKKENPILLALRKRNLPIAKLLWDKLSTLTLPPFESHRILRNIRRDTFKNVLYYIQRTSLAAKLMDFMLNHRGFLPIQKEDFSIIARQFNKIKKKRNKVSRFTMEVLGKCFARGMDETGLSFQEALTHQQRSFIPIRIVKQLERE